MSRVLIACIVVTVLLIGMALAVRICHRRRELSSLRPASTVDGQGLGEATNRAPSYGNNTLQRPGGHHRLEASRQATAPSAAQGSVVANDSPRPTPVPADSAPTVDPAAVAATVADNAKPYPERLALVEALARQADPQAIKALAAVAGGRNQLRQQAIAALGATGLPGAAPIAARYTADGDPQVAAAAVDALAKTQGEAAVPGIAEALIANRERVDGQQDLICGACIQVLTRIGSPSALPALARELAEVAGIRQNHDYGAAVVRAILACRNRAGAVALRTYAERLRRERDAMVDNPMGRRYLDGKITEAEAAAQTLEGR